MELTVRTELYAFQATRQVFFEVCYHLITPDICKGNLNIRIYREVTGEMCPLFLISGVAALAVLYPTVERIATRHKSQHRIRSFSSPVLPLETFVCTRQLTSHYAETMLGQLLCYYIY